MAGYKSAMQCTPACKEAMTTATHSLTECCSGIMASACESMVKSKVVPKFEEKIEKMCPAMEFDTMFNDVFINVDKAFATELSAPTSDSSNVWVWVSALAAF